MVGARVTTLLELCRESLAFAGLSRDDVRVELFDSDRLDGHTRWGILPTSDPVVLIARRLEDDPAHGVMTALHEAAHVLSGDQKHTYLFDEQWRRLSSRKFLSALNTHLEEKFGG